MITSYKMLQLSKTYDLSILYHLSNKFIPKYLAKHNKETLFRDTNIQQFYDTIDNVFERYVRLNYEKVDLT